MFKRLDLVAVLRGAIADQDVRLKVIEHRVGPPLLDEGLGPDEEP